MVCCSERKGKVRGEEAQVWAKLSSLKKNDIPLTLKKESIEEEFPSRASITPLKNAYHLYVYSIAIAIPTYGRSYSSFSEHSTNDMSLYPLKVHLSFSLTLTHQSSNVINRTSFYIYFFILSVTSVLSLLSFLFFLFRVSRLSTLPLSVLLPSMDQSREKYISGFNSTFSLVEG